jgi:hypothetical protein
MPSIDNLGQIFSNHADCYADTAGDLVVLAMTKETFVEVVDDLLVKFAYFINHKRVVLLNGEDWQGFYVNGKIVSQAHNLGEGRGLLHFLQQTSREYGFQLSDIDQFTCSDEDEKLFSEQGSLPLDFKDLKGNYESRTNA